MIWKWSQNALKKRFFNILLVFMPSLQMQLVSHMSMYNAFKSHFRYIRGNMFKNGSRYVYLLGHGYMVTWVGYPNLDNPMSFRSSSNLNIPAPI